MMEPVEVRMTLTSDDQEQAAIRASAIERHEADADRFVHWYDEMARSRFANAFAYGRAKIDRLLDECFKALHPGARILDVGCGTGEYIQRANELGFSASGVEPAEAMRKAAIEKNPGSTILNGVATELPFPDSTFDLVICIEVLRYLHSADNRQALREMYRVLKPGGTLFLTMVNRYALDGFYLNYHARKFLRPKARQRRCTSLRIYDARRNRQGGSGGRLFHGCASRCAARANADTVQTQHAHRSENRSGA